MAIQLLAEVIILLASSPTDNDCSNHYSYTLSFVTSQEFYLLKQTNESGTYSLNINIRLGQTIDIFRSQRLVLRHASVTKLHWL